MVQYHYSTKELQNHSTNSVRSGKEIRYIPSEKWFNIILPPFWYRFSKEIAYPGPKTIPIVSVLIPMHHRIIPAVHKQVHFLQRFGLQEGWVVCIQPTAPFGDVVAGVAVVHSAFAVEVVAFVTEGVYACKPCSVMQHRTSTVCRILVYYHRRTVCVNNA